MQHAEPARTMRPNRREILALGVGALVVASIPLTARSRPRLVRRRLPVMGTIGEVVAVHGDEARARKAVDAALAALRDVERTMTRFDADSDVGRANGRAGRDAVQVSPETADVVEAALAWAEGTDGLFDPCLGLATELWHPSERSAPPASSQLRRLAGRRLYRALDLDRSSGKARIHLREADAALDLGGIAKGYGVDRAVQAMRAHRIENGLVNVGGDLYALGCSADGDPWRVGIRSPIRPGRMAGSLEARDEAVATSGDYLRYFEHRGRRYHHLLDPGTATPRDSSLRSLTVRAGTCMAADAAATAAFGLEPDQAEDLLRGRSQGPRIVHSA